MQNPFILFDNGPENGTAVFSMPKEMIVAWEAGEVSAAFARVMDAQKQGGWLAGYASYELGYLFEARLNALLPPNRKTPLLCFGVFDAPVRSVTQEMLYRGQAEMLQAGISSPQAAVSLQEYSEQFDTVKAFIKAGDIYQANLTFPMSARYWGSALGLYFALQRAQPVQHAALVCLGEGPDLLSRSPELFFSLSADGIIKTRPMKGTVRRGVDRKEDHNLKLFLQNDPKNRAENLMIVDLLRNDISRIAKGGTVQVPELFTIESYTTLHQMTSVVCAEIEQGTGLYSLFAALFPCGSITGAPKIRAMEIIADMEEEARGIYCGSIGWMAPDGRASFNVAIRTLSLFGDHLVKLNVGGGIVYDSTAASEYEEALWKARYTNLLPLT